ncbi:MAG: AmmeMemoRadiSam system protein B [Gemmataceae bacterium]|nr:AmmeMemoRadiSam system protein B [Gemmataceae bacterium]MDW8263977.1 AmmeMemoRadiSam system protein B [Gemmataceae bacterium]
MKTRVANPTLAEVLDRHTTIGTLWHREGERIRCVACGHRCLIGPEQRGICKVRFERDGQLRVPFHYVAALQCDPVEKKPFFHVYPSSDALTFGMMGCDLHCAYCQNWLTSQALRDEQAVAPIRPVSPAQLVAMARREGARLVVSSYNEPLITAEWAVAVFQEAALAGLTCAFVSNGNATPEVLDFLKPWIQAYKVDLKCFSERHYRTLGGTLRQVTDTIRGIHDRGIWLEVVTLIVPGFNDSPAELRDTARFLASVSPDIPWHVTAFHKDYRMTEPDNTTARQLIEAAEIGAEEGLRFVYAGNRPGEVGPWENTRCPKCQSTVIERIGYLVRSYRITPEGRCPDCQTPLPGVWPKSPEEVRTGNDLRAYLSRRPRAMTTPSEVPIPKVEKPTVAVGGMQTMPLPTPTAPTAASSPASRFSPEQERAILTATAELIHASVQRRPAYLSDPTLAGAADRPVAGAFVSLKRGRHLRGCCGQLGPAIPLAAALHDAVERTVWDDARFPPVSGRELEHLKLEIWVLHRPERVEARGEERLQAVTIGRHGLQVVRGQARGLLLPGVPVDHAWDVRTFLEQVCVKAGLHPSLWKDDATELYRFEGDVIRGRLQPHANGASMARRPAKPGAKQLQAYADFCRRNIINHLCGAVPIYYLPGLADGQVAGVHVSVRPPRSSDALHFFQLSMRPGVPLQSTLFALSQNAAQALAARGISAEELESLAVGVSIFFDTSLHGTVADPDLAGVEPEHRAVLVMERNKMGIVRDPEQPAERLLELAAGQARVSRPASSAVFSLECATTEPRVALSTAPRPVAGPAIRPPAVAGTFYPGTPDDVQRMLDTLLQGERRSENWPAVMVPHAGWIYSGRIAAQVLRRVRIPRTVIILGPKHTSLGMDWAVAPHETWAFPGGSLPSDPALARALAQAIPGLELDAAAHQREHGIEVELPLLARLAPGTRVVGITIGGGDLESCRAFADGLAGVLRSLDEQPLLVISSDMNHFATDAETRQLDELALSALDRLDPEAVYDTVMENNISMCGVLPAVIVLETLHRLGRPTRSERVAYATSADVTGDTSRVVGYAGMLFG